MLDGNAFRVRAYITNHDEDMEFFSLLVGMLATRTAAGEIEQSSAEGMLVEIEKKINAAEEKLLEVIDQFVYDKELQLPDVYYCDDGDEVE